MMGFKSAFVHSDLGLNVPWRLASMIKSGMYIRDSR